MALIFFDGFDASQSSTGVSTGSYLARMGYSGTTTATAQTGRNGSGISLYNTVPVYPLAVSKTSLVAGVGFRRDALTGTAQVLALKQGTTYQLTLHTDATGAITLRRGTTTGTVLASAPAGTITAGAWNYFELKAVVDSAAGSYEVRMNGATLFSGSATNTQAQATANVDGIELGSATSYIDDFYLLDLTGSSPWNDFLGPVQSVALMPTADGASAQWTQSTGVSQFGCIDEKPANDDTDYVSAASTGLLDLCSTQTVGGTDTVLGVAQRAMVRKTDAGVAQLTPTLRIGTTNYAGTTQAIGDTYTVISQLYQTSPATAVQWTAAEVNGAQLVGFKSA